MFIYSVDIDWLKQFIDGYIMQIDKTERWQGCRIVQYLGWRQDPQDKSE